MNSPIATRIEHTLATPFGLREEVERLCQEARLEGYRAVVVPGSRVAEACEYLEGSNTKVSCLVGFPLGWSDADAKRYEVEAAVDAGAQEIEYVPSLARIKEQQYPAVLRELRDAADACDERPLKILIEAGLWTDSELQQLVQIIMDSGAQYIATGLVPRLDLIADVRELTGADFGIKCQVMSMDAAPAAMEMGADLISVSRLARPGAKIPGFGI